MTSMMSMSSLRFGRYSIFQWASKSLRASGSQLRAATWIDGYSTTARDAHKESGLRAKDRSGGTDRRLPDERKVGAEDEPGNPSGQVQREELGCAHHALDDGRARALSEHVEKEVDYAGVEEDRDEEPEGLVWSSGAVSLAVEPAEPADIGHGACGPKSMSLMRYA